MAVTTTDIAIIVCFGLFILFAIALFFLAMYFRPKTPVFQNRVNVDLDIERIHQENIKRPDYLDAIRDYTIGAPPLEQFVIDNYQSSANRNPEGSQPQEAYAFQSDLNRNLEGSQAQDELWNLPILPKKPNAK